MVKPINDFTTEDSPRARKAKFLVPDLMAAVKQMSEANTAAGVEAALLAVEFITKKIREGL